MPGGILQLVTIGVQDLFLVGSPEITLFKTIFRRHTNFSKEHIDIKFKSNLEFNKKSTCTISKSGDIINQLYLKLELPEVQMKFKFTPLESAIKLLNDNGYSYTPTHLTLEEEYPDIIAFLDERELSASDHISEYDCIIEIVKETPNPSNLIPNLLRVTDAHEMCEILARNLEKVREISGQVDEIGFRSTVLENSDTIIKKINDILVEKLLKQKIIPFPTTEMDVIINNDFIDEMDFYNRISSKISTSLITNEPFQTFIARVGQFTQEDGILAGYKAVKSMPNLTSYIPQLALLNTLTKIREWFTFTLILNDNTINVATQNNQIHYGSTETPDPYFFLIDNTGIDFIVKFFQNVTIDPVTIALGQIMTDVLFRAILEELIIAVNYMEIKQGTETTAETATEKLIRIISLIESLESKTNFVYLEDIYLILNLYLADNVFIRFKNNSSTNINIIKNLVYTFSDTVDAELRDLFYNSNRLPVVQALKLGGVIKHAFLPQQGFETSIKAVIQKYIDFLNSLLGGGVIEDSVIEMVLFELQFKQNAFDPTITDYLKLESIDTLVKRDRQLRLTTPFIPFVPPPQNIIAPVAVPKYFYTTDQFSDPSTLLFEEILNLYYQTGATALTVYNNIFNAIFNVELIEKRVGRIFGDIIRKFDDFSNGIELRNLNFLFLSPEEIVLLNTYDIFMDNLRLSIENVFAEHDEFGKLLKISTVILNKKLTFFQAFSVIIDELKIRLEITSQPNLLAYFDAVVLEAFPSPITFTPYSFYLSIAFFEDPLGDFRQFFDPLITPEKLYENIDLLRVRYNTLATVNDLVNYMNDTLLNTVDFLRQIMLISPTDVNFYAKIINLFTEQKKIYEKEIQNITIMRPKLADMLVREQTRDIYGKFAWIKKLGHFIIDKISLEIGGQLIDELYGDWINIWHELSRDPNKERAYQNMIGDIPELTDFNTEVKKKYILYIPIPFWFCKHLGAGLPLICLMHNDVDVNLHLNKLENCIIKEDDTVFVTTVKGKEYKFDELNISGNLTVDYIYIDQDERKRFSSIKHELLIEQLQYSGEINIDYKTFKADDFFTTRLFFHDPCKELVWVFKRSKHIQDKNYHYYGMKDDGSETPLETALLKFNGINRFQTRSGFYFDTVQPYQHHSSTPADGIHVYSFGWIPESLQPSGAANLSRIDVILFLFSFKKQIEEILLSGETLKLYIYGLFNNVLRILSGLAGLAFFR